MKFLVCFALLALAAIANCKSLEAPTAAEAAPGLPAAHPEMAAPGPAPELLKGAAQTYYTYPYFTYTYPYFTNTYPFFNRYF